MPSVFLDFATFVFFFLIFTGTTWRGAAWTFKILKRSLATIQATVLYYWHHHERLYNPFLQVSKYLLSKLEQNLMQIPCLW